MGNYLKMTDKRRVLALLELGWPYRRIERETGVRRETIARYDPRRQPKAANVSTGSDVSADDDAAKAANLSAGSAERTGHRDVAAPYHAQIEAGLRQGLDGAAHLAGPVREVAYPHSYASVRRYVRRLKQPSPSWSTSWSTRPVKRARWITSKDRRPLTKPRAVGVDRGSSA